jgi:ketosteroid isomerase-like protein
VILHTMRLSKAMRFATQVKHFFASYLKYDMDYLFDLLFCDVKIVFQTQTVAILRLLQFEVAANVPIAYVENACFAIFFKISNKSS